MKIRVTMWNEGRHEKNDPPVTKIYPEGMHTALAAGFKDREFEITRVCLDDPEQGLPDELLERTDVLTWWDHRAKGEVDDGLVDRIQERVLSGMGLVVLHSAHRSKILCRLLGTHCTLSWRRSPGGELERVWIANPSHPIAKGLPAYFEIPASETYGEPFAIPTPDDIITMSWYVGGEVFRSGVTFTRGYGRIFYFSPGHEDYPIYHNPMVQQIIGNAIEWAMLPHKPERTLTTSFHRPVPPNQ